MSFANPVALLLLLLVPSFLLFFVGRERTRRKILIHLGDSALILKLVSRDIERRRYWKFGLWSLTLVSLILALARPVWGIDVDVVAGHGVSIMFVLDASTSMDAQDILPSRLERAKLSLDEMFQGLAGNELGLIVFAGTPFVQFPLTTDTFSVKAFLKSVSTSSISRQGTDIDAALRLAMDSFKRANTIKPIIVLMSDGENSGNATLSSLIEVREHSITIYTIGYGDAQGATIPVRDNNGNITGYKSDRTGNLVLSKLDEAILKTIAAQTGGLYQQAAPDGQETKRLIELINQMDAATLGRDVQTTDIERFEIFVALTVLALSLEIFLPDMRNKAA